MPDKGALQKFSRAEGAAPRRDGGLTKERQATGRSFHLELHPKTGQPEGFAWALYQRFKLFDREDPERLVILFAGGAAVITGYHLIRVVEWIAEERARAVTEHDVKVAQAIGLENESRSASEREPVILTVKAEPDFDIAYRAATATPEENSYDPNDPRFH